MAGARSFDENLNPLGDINTTPLIDVMLVLLVMLIITVPPQTHRIAIDLPKDGKVRERDPVLNVLAIERSGEVLWNGSTISDADLKVTLAATARMEPQPELHFRPDSEARYERVDEVLAMTKRAAVTRMGFVGNEQYGSF